MIKHSKKILFLILFISFFVIFFNNKNKHEIQNAEKVIVYEEKESFSFINFVSSQKDKSLDSFINNYSNIKDDSIKKKLFKKDKENKESVLGMPITLEGTIKEFYNGSENSEIGLLTKNTFYLITNKGNVVLVQSKIENPSLEINDYVEMKEPILLITSDTNEFFIRSTFSELKR